ncbi:MAG: hypothetical protein IJS46_03000, partial [Kiritimatiellae bacterium]|nr:hypothetical protein [Kiritimatiellia bacterium]
AAWSALWLAATFSRLCRRRPAARRFFAGAAAAAAVFCALLATSVAASERLLASPLAAVPESVPVEEESGEN